VISRKPYHFRIDAAETKLAKIKLIHEKIDHPYRVVLGNVLFQPRREQCFLITISADHKARHMISPCSSQDKP
jgi:hypothetical protein